MAAEIVDVSDPRWSAVLADLVHDVHHLPAWSDAEATHRGWTAVAAIVESEACDVVVPLLRRELGNGSWDAVSPYGYGGPVFSSRADQSMRRAALDEACKKLGAAGCVSIFLRGHPLLDGQQVELGRIVNDADTLVVDLTASEQERLRRMRSGHRYDIRRCRREGTQIRIGPVDERLHQFVELYTETMERLGADQFYRFGSGYFERLRDGLGRGLILVTAHQGDCIDAASLFTVSESAGVIGYHLSGSRVGPASHQPVKLMIAETMNWAAERGLTKLNLGGGVGTKRDSLFSFKKGFGADEFSYRSYGIVTDRLEYARRTQQTQGARPAYFPSYRDVDTESPDKVASR